MVFYRSFCSVYFGTYFRKYTPKRYYNFTKEEKELAKDDKYYDWILYLLVPFQLFVVYYYLITISKPAISTLELVGYTMMMGTILGVNGINGGHELGHKTDHPLKVFLAHVLLMTSLQNHFMTYHNSGHHRDVATPNDLTTAKKGQSFYTFAIQSQIGGYFKTWKLEKEKLTRKGKSSLLNPHDNFYNSSLEFSRTHIFVFWL